MKERRRKEVGEEEGDWVGREGRRGGEEVERKGGEEGKKTRGKGMGGGGV